MMEDNKQELRFTSFQAAMLALALAVSVVYFFAHPRLCSRDFQHFPGIGLMISQWAVVLLCVVAAAVEKRLVRGWLPWLLGALSLLLGLCYGLYANNWLRLMNLPVLCALTWVAIGALTGQYDAAVLSGRGLWEAFCGFFRSLFKHVSLPFHALAARRKSGSKRWTGAIVGLVLCIPVFLVALLLLASADSVFNGMLTEACAAIERMDMSALINLILALLFTLPLFSLLYASTQPGRTAETKPLPDIPSAVFAVTLGALALLYAVFGYVQIRYLFGGAETALVQNGYAEYARSGFFQLVAVAFLTLLVVLPALTLCAGSRGIRALCGAVAALTLVITGSAFFRMKLYIDVYGLSLLRALTLWAILMILAALIAVMVKCVRPSLSICPALCLIVLVSWVGLNLSNVDLRVAQYNVRAYNNGALERLDTKYLIGLSPDVLPALEEIEDEDRRLLALERAAYEWEPCRPCAYDWSLAWRGVPEGTRADGTLP